MTCVNAIIHFKSVIIELLAMLLVRRFGAMGLKIFLAMMLR